MTSLISSHHLNRSANITRNEWIHFSYQNQLQRPMFRNGSNREPGGVTGVNKNCVDKIMDFLENTLKIEDTKSIQIEKA